MNHQNPNLSFPNSNTDPYSSSMYYSTITEQQQQQQNGNPIQQHQTVSYQQQQPQFQRNPYFSDPNLGWNGYQLGPTTQQPPYNPHYQADGHVVVPQYVPQPVVSYAPNPPAFQHCYYTPAAYGMSTYPGVTLPNTANSFHRNTNGKYAPKNAKIMQSMWGEVCKIACDTKDVLDIHISGKKHKKNLEKIRGPTNTNPFHINTNHNHAPKKKKVVQSTWCEVCKIACNTKDVLDIHRSGKKHKINLEKLRGPTSSSPALAIIPHQPVTPITPSYLPLPISNSSSIDKPIIGPPYLPLPITNSSSIDKPTIGPSYLPLPISNSSSTDKLVIGPLENPEKNLSHNARKTKKKRAAAVEDLESKRVKVLKGGAAADAVQTCVYCNVVCNSETVFKSHIAGKKHATMVNKFAISGGGASVV